LQNKIEILIQNGTITEPQPLCPIFQVHKGEYVNIGDLFRHRMFYEVGQLNGSSFGFEYFWKKDFGNWQIGSKPLKFFTSDDNTFNRTARFFLIGKRSG